MALIASPKNFDLQDPLFMLPHLVILDFGLTA